MATPDEQARDAREIERLRGVVAERMGLDAGASHAAGPAVALVVLESGDVVLDMPAGVTQAEAEAILVRAFLRHFLET